MTLSNLQVFSNAPGPRILICPSDTRLPAKLGQLLARTNISYFLAASLASRAPNEIDAGDRNLSVNGAPAPPGMVRIGVNDTIGWTAEMHNASGNVVMGDGSVQQMSSLTLAGSMKAQAKASASFVVP